MNAPYHNKALPEGAVLREWRLESVLGVGGFGIVYRGRGLYFDELVAIKEYFPSAISDRLDDTTVAPSDSSSEEIYALGLHKFVEEAKVLWNLSKPERHPNIVSVRALFEINGTAYMVMDFESGVSLSQMLKKGHKFNEAGLLALIRPIAEGLDRAHRGGVLHRDIKPANILVDDSGRSVLIDFGSARFESGQATSTKVTFYTPPYAAIEQYVKTYPQGAWTDIYALGVTLYECIAGEKPPEVLERLHGGLGLDLSSRDWPGFSKTFTRAIDAAMAIKPAERPQSIPQWLRMFDGDAGAFDDEATRIAVTQPAPTAKPAPPPAAPEPAAPAAKGKGMLLVGGGAIAALGAVAAAAVMLGGPRAKAPSASVAPAAAVAATPGKTLYASPLPDIDGLIADAGRAARPAKEIEALKATRGKASALDAEIGKALGAPDKAKPLIAQLDQMATDTARGESAALTRDVDLQLRDVARNPAWLAAQGKGAVSDSAKNPVLTARLAKSNFDAAQAGVAAAAKADTSIAAARASVLAYQDFVAALADAKRALIAAEQSKFASVDASARLAAAEVAKLAGGAKPWLFASKADKDGYKLAQENAAQARALEAQLDGMGSAARTAADLKHVNAMVTKAGDIKARLDRLKSSSTAARAKPKA